MSKGVTIFGANGEDYTINDPNIAAEFSTSTAYAIGDYCYYEGNLCRFKVAHAAGAWSSSDVDPVKMGERMKTEETLRVFNDGITQADIAPEFNAATAYGQGQFVTYEGVLYRLTADHAANTTWANTSKIGTNVGVELNYIRADYDKKTNWLGNRDAESDGTGIAKNFWAGGDGWLGYESRIFLYAKPIYNGIKRMKIKTKLDNKNVKLFITENQGDDYVIVDQLQANTGTQGYVEFNNVYFGGEKYIAIQGCFVVRADMSATAGYISDTSNIEDETITELTANTEYGIIADVIAFPIGDIDPDYFSGTDAEKLQQAFDACEIGGGNIVIRRKFTTDETITIRHLYEKNNRIIVHGESEFSEICIDALYGFEGVNGSTGGVIFRDLKLSSKDPVNTTHSFMNGGATGSNATLVNIIFENCYLYSLKYISYGNKYLQSLWFIGCIIRMGGTMINTGGNQWYNCLIQKCIIEGGTTVGSIGWPEAVNIRDNVIEGNPEKTAITVAQGAYAINIEGNYFEQNDKDIVLALTTAERNVRIAGNFMANTITSPIQLPASANENYNSTIMIINNKFIASSDVSKAQYMIYGTDGEIYDEVFCAFNSGNITSLDATELKVLDPTDFAKRS